MKSIGRNGSFVKQIRWASFLLAGMLCVGCSSTPEPQPEPSKKEIQRDSDRFFEKMKSEENRSLPFYLCTIRSTFYI